MEIKPYKKDFDHSYTLGAFPTIEMLKNREKYARKVIISPKLKDREIIENICKEKNIPIEENAKVIERLGDKENIYILGIFDKFTCELDKDKPHIVLVNPGNMGNMGTIIRTAIGMGFKNLAVIRPGADIYDPKTVRASMGAVFRINFKYFDDFKEYMSEFPSHKIYTFMLDADEKLGTKHESDGPYSLVFGNESTGLPEYFHNYGTSIIIPQSDEVDSLNITIAASIAMYVFNGHKVGQD